MRGVSGTPSQYYHPEQRLCSLSPVQQVFCTSMRLSLPTTMPSHGLNAPKLDTQMDLKAPSDLYRNGFETRRRGLLK